MKFLTKSECEQWCSDRGRIAPRSVEGHGTLDFSVPEDAGRRVALARFLWDLADDELEGERLLWVTDWSVWPSGEHLPLFTRWRASFGETRPLIEAPGNVVGRGDESDGLSIWVIAILFLWDCWLYKENGSLIMIDNDECGSVYGVEGQEKSDVKKGLKEFGVLLP